MGPHLTEREARELTDRIVALSRAEETVVSATGGWDANTRYAVNRITTSGNTSDASVTVTARFGKRSASVSTNDLDDRGLELAVRRAEELARRVPEDPETMPLLRAQEYAPSAGWHDATARLEAEPRAAIAEAAIDQVRAGGELDVAGFLEVSGRATAVANSAGLFAYHSATAVDYTLTVRTRDGTGSGWARGAHRDWAAVDSVELHRRAIDKARASRDPRPVEPGRYTVVLEPAAVADLMWLLASALDARRADEGRSPFSAAGGGNRIGERIVDPRVTIRSDPAAVGSAPHDGEGLPLGAVPWIADGVLRNLSYSRFWAAKQGTEPTGEPTSLVMSGGEESLADLVAGTRKGLLVTRMWYIRSVDSRTILHTGLTRDGTFLIEDGEITHPVTNFRWNDSPLFVLRNLEALGRPVRVSESRIVPSLRSADFSVSSISEAV